jgi:hypothetical protein
MLSLHQLGSVTRDYVIRSDVVTARSVLPDRRFNTWYEEYSFHMRLTPDERDAVRTFFNDPGAMVRPYATNHCRKVDAAAAAMNFGHEYASYSDVCYCRTCMPSENGIDFRLPMVDIGYLFIYPSYDTKPGKGAMTSNQKVSREYTHEYISDFGGIVPTPLPNVFAKHKLRFEQRVQDAIIPCTQFKEAEYIKTYIKDMVSSKIEYMVIFLMFCGHGADKGAFIASDGKHVYQSDVATILEKSGFEGTVICVYNCCSAEDAVRDDAPFCGWTSQLPFKWVHVYSSGIGEAQMVHNSHHFAETIAEVMKVRPEYVDLQDELVRKFRETWKPVFDPKDKDAAMISMYGRYTDARFWMPPPIVKAGGRYSGRFLEPAEDA